MNTSLRFAASQFPVSKSIESNYRYILKHMRQASDEGVDIAHFPEAALPGYIGRDISTFSSFDWKALNKHTEKVMASARNLKMWVVVGSCRQVPNSSKPRNCLHIISREGEVVASYDKRKLYGKEETSYGEGARPVTRNINGVKCGFLICYES